MMLALKGFYKSKEWENFRKVVIAQRTNAEDGFVYCDHCGKPIVNKYDLVVHHVKELNEANVGNAMISLNPENVACVHFRCHNQIHNRFGFGNSGYKPMPKKVYVVYGSPCAGKTRWVRGVATENDLIVDVDSIWECISSAERYRKPAALRSVVFDVRDKLYDVIKYRSGNWQNAYIIIGGARRGDRDRLVQRIAADEAIFIDASKEECLARTRERGEQWREYINDWFENFQPKD